MVASVMRFFFIHSLYKEKQKYIDKMSSFLLRDSAMEIYNIIEMNRLKNE